jgi:hypothetical protein
MRPAVRVNWRCAPTGCLLDVPVSSTTSITSLVSMWFCRHRSNVTAHHLELSMQLFMINWRLPPVFTASYQGKSQCVARVLRLVALLAALIDEHVQQVDDLLLASG